MIDAACSRREFLRKIVLLSSGVLMLSAITTACPRNYSALPTVVGMYFYDAGMRKVELRGNQAVPVRTVFELAFSADMKMDTAPYSSLRVSLMDSHGNSSDYAVSWVNARTLSVTPNADLSLNMDYTLSVDDAEDSNGNPLNTYVSESAMFRTTGS